MQLKIISNLKVTDGTMHSLLSWFLVIFSEILCLTEVIVNLNIMEVEAIFLTELTER